MQLMLVLGISLWCGCIPADKNAATPTLLETVGDLRDFATSFGLMLVPGTASAVL